MSNDAGRSLNPASRSDEVASAAFQDGAISGMLTMIPSAAAVWFGMTTSAKFRKATNVSSRTALVIMPPLFAFAFSSERKVEHMKQEMANEYEHSNKVNKWASEQHRQQNQNSTKRNLHLPEEDKIKQIYSQSIVSGVRIVPGDTLGPHHVMANFWQENPFKILAGLGIPSVLYIFKGRSDKAHLQVQSMIMHTRVYGQGLVIALLLGIFAGKSYMDMNGKYITEADAERRAEDMRLAKEDMLMMLERGQQEQKHMEELSKHMFDNESKAKFLKNHHKKSTKHADVPE